MRAISLARTVAEKKQSFPILLSPAGIVMTAFIFFFLPFLLRHFFLSLSLHTLFCQEKKASRTKSTEGKVIKVLQYIYLLEQVEEAYRLEVDCHLGLMLQTQRYI